MNNEIDFRTPWKNVELAKVRATINGLALAIKNTRKQLKETKNEKQTKRLMHLKNALSWECRHQNLALAFARKKNYFDLEKTCKEKPDYIKVFLILKNYDFVLFDIKNASQDTVFSWLKGENLNA